MPGWLLADTHATDGCTFQRPLDVFELCFIWDGRFNGTADTLHHYELSLTNDSQDAQLFSEENIIRAWLSTKRRYPLMGATVRGADGAPLRLKVPSDSGADVGTGFDSAPHFFVREGDLSVLHPDETIFGQVADAEEARHQAAAILNGPRPLSENLLAQLYVFHEASSGVHHLMLLVAHCVMDVMSSKTVARCMLDTLARFGEPEPTQLPLEERLAMAITPTDLEPPSLRSLSPAIRRWRRAVGMMIYQSKMERRQGGHTLPCRVTHSTAHTAARSGLASIWLTETQTAAVIANCRLHGLTFGTAYLALAQVAMTRVLYRRYLRGEIPEEEWEYRKKQQYISGGPLNLRPYLDKAWFENGGGGESVLSIGMFFYQLPFMTLGGTTAERQKHVLSNGAPPFSDLLTFDRFLHRARSVKKQAKGFFGHPLFLEILDAGSLARTERIRRGALKRIQHVVTANGHGTQHGDEEVIAVSDIPFVWAHGGSSLGNMDFVSPTEYPLLPTHPLSPYSAIPHPVRAGYVVSPSNVSYTSEANAKPKIVVENFTLRLHMRPAQLSLSAATTRGRMNMYVFYDENVFEEGVVKEWLDEVRDAVLWYLCRKHRSASVAQRNGCARSNGTRCLMMEELDVGNA